jgi:peptidyl-prolyl cis-trans isomerase C
MFSGIIGCDKISDMMKPKKKEVVSALVVTPAVKGTVIAKVNNLPLTLEELNQEVDAENSMVNKDRPEDKITTRDQKIKYLKERLIRRVLLFQEAKNRGLERKEEILQALEKTKQDLLVVELVRQEAEKVDVASSEIEEYYNTYQAQLKDPEERRIREIGVSSEQEAKEVLIQSLQGTDFAAMARERSKLASAKDGGDLGYLKPNVKSAQFNAMAFSSSLEKGQTSNIFKNSDGYYYIVKIEDIRGGAQKTLTEMWEDIKRGLTFLKQERKIEDLISKLSGSAKIEIYEGEVK